MTKIWLLLGLFIFSLPGSFAFAVKTGADPCLGPPVEVDLEKDMPPVDDQGASSWCGTFSAKAIFDYYIHENCLKYKKSDRCPYTSENRVSAFDLNSLNSAADQSDYGKNIDLSARVPKGSFYEGVQVSGILRDKDLPLDQNLFGTAGSDGTLALLEAYYSTKRLAKDGQRVSCATSSSVSRIEELIPALKQLFDAVSSSNTEAEGQDEFLSLFSRIALAIPAEKSALRTQIMPPFNIEHETFNDKEAYSAKLVSDLLAKNPVEISVCGLDFRQKLHIIDSPKTQTNDSCGLHAMVAMGFRRAANGVCQVHLRNSWGDRWPSDRSGNGDIWVDMADFLSIHRDQDLSITYITPRTPGTPIKNREVTQISVFEGKTWNGSGYGTVVFQNNVIFKGEVRSGTPYCGSISPLPDGRSGCLKEGIIGSNPTNGSDCDCNLGR